MNPRRFSVVFAMLFLLVPLAAYAFVPGVVLPAAAPAQVTLVERTADSLVLHVEVPELQWTRTEAADAVWDVIGVEEMGFTSEVGTPLLPVLTRLVAVGPTEGVTVDVITARRESFFDVNLIPAQPPMDRSATELPPFAFDHAAYAVDAFYPASHVALGDPVIVHGKRFVPVHFYPVRYNPGTGELRVLHAATLAIRGGGHNEINPLRRELSVSPAFAPIFDGLSLSFDRKDAQDNWATQDGTILMVVHDEFAAAAQHYVDWKRKKGLPVEVYLRSEVPDAGQNPQALKQFFYQRYHDADLPPLDYIVLVGDNEHIKTMIGIRGCAADSKYATLDGDDYFPDVIIARFPANNLRQLTNTIQKTIAYETAPSMARPAWFHQGLAMSGSDSVDDQNATFVGDVLLNDGGFDRVDYLFTSMRNINVANISGAINQGRSWVVYFGHGAATFWSSPRTPFTNTNVRELTNEGMPTVITDIACDNAHFDATQECFAEVWVENSATTGAAAIFAASRNTPFGYTDKLGRGVAVGHFRQGHLTFGTASYFGKIFMYHFYPEPAGRTCEEVMQHYLIFGDPELPVWSDTPAPLVVDHPATIEVDAKMSVELTVTLNDAPLGSALVHVWRDDEFDFVARTTPEGVALFDLDDDVAVGDSQGVVTGQNGLPYEGVIEIVPAAPPGDDDTGDDDATDDDATDDDATDDDATDDDATDDDAADDDDDDDDSGCGCPG